MQIPLLHPTVFELFKFAIRIIHSCFWPSLFILRAYLYVHWADQEDTGSYFIFCERLVEIYCVHLQHLPENQLFYLQPLPEATQEMH